jgi:hypothetical protein
MASRHYAVQWSLGGASHTNSARNDPKVSHYVTAIRFELLEVHWYKDMVLVSAETTWHAT